MCVCVCGCVRVCGCVCVGVRGGYEVVSKIQLCVQFPRIRIHNYTNLLVHMDAPNKQPELRYIYCT